MKCVAETKTAWNQLRRCLKFKLAEQTAFVQMRKDFMFFAMLQIPRMAADLTYYLWQYWRWEDKLEGVKSCADEGGLTHMTRLQVADLFFFLLAAWLWDASRCKGVKRKRENWHLRKTLSFSVLWLTALLGDTLLPVIKHARRIYKSSFFSLPLKRWDLKTCYNQRAVD